MNHAIKKLADKAGVEYTEDLARFAKAVAHEVSLLTEKREEAILEGDHTGARWAAETLRGMGAEPRPDPMRFSFRGLLEGLFRRVAERK